jgi:CRP-like cAMP-binding protein
VKDFLFNQGFSDFDISFGWSSFFFSKERQVKIFDMDFFVQGAVSVSDADSATIKAEEDGTEVAYIIRGALEALEKSAPRFTTIFYKTIARILMERLINLDREYVNIASKLKNTEEAQKIKELREKIFKTLK